MTQLEKGGDTVPLTNNGDEPPEVEISGVTSNQQSCRRAIKSYE